MHGTAGIWGLMAVLITSDDATFAGQLSGLGAIFVDLYSISHRLGYLIHWWESD